MGKPGKIKPNAKTKLRKWKKGNSSSSNPSSQKYREKARSKFFHTQPTSKGTKGLTMEALSLHDEFQSENGAMDTASAAHLMDDDRSSIGGKTFGTFLSGLSDCTNVTFRKIQRYWLSNSAQHREVCAVLAAITEVIRDQGGNESNTAYFAALVTALASVQEAESAAAVTFLLSMTVKNTPPAVLQSKFGEVSKLLMDILSESAEKAGNACPTALIRSTLSTLSTVLRWQSYEVWTTPSTLNVYQALLMYTVHTKPKIRKAAQSAVCSVLLASEFIGKGNTATGHPAAAPTAKFCTDQLEKGGGISSESFACHTVTLLGRVMHSFPSSFLKRSCETILRLMTLSDPIVKSVCLQSLHNMFSSEPNSERLSAELNGQIMTALYDYYPHAADSQLAPAWLAVMEKAVLNLATKYSNAKDSDRAHILAVAHIPKLCANAFKLLLSTNSEVSAAACSSIKVIMKDGSEFLKQPCNLEKGEVDKFFNCVVKLLSDGLKYKYHPVWSHVLSIYQITFKHLILPEHFDLIKENIQSMVNLRNTPQFQYRTELDASLHMAIETLGPKLFLQAAPLQIDGSETEYDFPRSWILPLLKKSVCNTNLAHFFSYFLPLAAKLKSQATQLKAAGNDSVAKAYHTLHEQCWDLLPSYCHGAKDIATSFPNIARILGKTLNDNKSLKLIVMQGLRNVLNGCKGNETDTAAVARFAKNFVPILFNLYTTYETGDDTRHSQKELLEIGNKQKSPERLAALETVRLYLSITPPELVSLYSDTAQKRVFDGENEKDATRLALLDLLVNMVTYLQEDKIRNLYKVMKAMFNSPNHSMQKKAYRILEVVCGSEKPQCHNFVKTHLVELKALLLNGLSTAAPSSKGPRIKCMHQVMLQLCADDASMGGVEFIKEIVPEVILCTREAKRSREAAFSLLVAAANCFASSEATMDSTSLDTFFNIIFLGLTGSPITITSTIFAISRLVFDFKSQMSSQLLNQTITNVCLMLGCNTREVCKAALGFIMVLFKVLDRATLAQHTKEILAALLNWKPETRRHFRFRVKKLLQRLVQKFGFDTVYSMTPEEHRKQLQNIRKTDERLKRKKAQAKDDDGDDDDEVDGAGMRSKETIDEILADSSDSDDDDKPKSKGKVAKRPKKAAWLQDNEQEPVDLLDPSVSGRIIGANPTRTKPKKSVSFKTSSDGRLIIPDGNDSDEEDDDVETNKMMSNIGISSAAANKASQKRKTEAEDEDILEMDDSKHGYQPGGIGIHRELNVEQSGSQYKSKKAGGDVKKKGTKHEPYAYVPLSSDSLNRRKRKKLSGQFNGLIKAAKKGASKGKKQNSRKQKLKKL